jgi:NhaP-type Na+/H+ and K+/H+ antiporter
MTRDPQLILAVGVVLAAGVIAAGLAARLRLPALVLFCALGMLVGSDGLGFRSVELLNIVFFAVLLSAAVQGATVEALANRLLPRGRSDSASGPA